MITAVLTFIHARKWLVELILLLAVVGAVTWFCHHLIEVGVQQQKDADAAQYAKLKETADKETGRLQGIADTAEKARDQESKALDDYRTANPLHGSLCLNPAQQSGRVPETGATHPSNAGTSTSTSTVQPVSAGDSGTGGQGQPDIRHMLDLLAGRADQVSGELREYQARF